MITFRKKTKNLNNFLLFRLNKSMCCCVWWICTDQICRFSTICMILKFFSFKLLFFFFFHFPALLQYEYLHRWKTICDFLSDFIFIPLHYLLQRGCVVSNKEKSIDDRKPSKYFAWNSCSKHINFDFEMREYFSFYT